MKKIILIALFLTTLTGIGTSVYYYTKYQEVSSKLTSPEIQAQEEVKRIIAKLSTFIDLPTDEEPTLATVLDKDKLTDQPFFVKAENGDKVVIYSKARKAILYREEANKIIEVAPIEISQPEVAASPAPTPRPTPVSTPEPAPAEAPAQ